MANYFLGGDASKGYSDFVIINDKKTTIEPVFQLDDTCNGHQQLKQILVKFFENHPDDILYAALESTGGYENNWIKFFQDMSKNFPIQVARINPRGINHDSKAALQKSTNDKISARNIAEYQINHPQKIVYNNESENKSLKRTLTALLAKIKSRAALLNQMETLLYSANPELFLYHKESTPQWLLKLLQSYPTADALANASVDELVLIPYLNATKANNIINAAKNSVASASDNLTAYAIKRLATDILYFNNQIKQEINFLKKNVHCPQIDLLETFKGIGTYSALFLVIEIGSIDRFPSPKHLASFLGLHPVYKESGDGSWNWRMSKQGRKKARAILYMVAFSAISNNSLIHDLYQNYRSRGKGHKAALGICMHKICRIIYGMLKNNVPFDENIDRNNQKKNFQQNKLNKANNTRRFQKEDPIAPISYRQTKKRKERERSQSDKVTMHEIQILTPS